MQIIKLHKYLEEEKISSANSQQERKPAYVFQNWMSYLIVSNRKKVGWRRDIKK